MNEVANRIINYTKENSYVLGCTISKKINDFIYIYSVAPNTDISKESYDIFKLLYVLDAEIIFNSEKELVLKNGDIILTPKKVEYGIKSSVGGIYLSIDLRSDNMINEIIKSGEVFKLTDLIPYKDNSIVNLDIISNETLKVALMSFDEGCALSEHRAPGEAIVFALDGEAIIGYEGKEYHIHQGEQFKFDKNGLHSVKALTKFKMLLLLTL